MTTGAAGDRRLFLLCCAIGFCAFFGAYLRIPVLPLLAATLGGGPREVGFINASFTLTAGLLAIPSGLLSDRIGRRIPLLAGLLAIATSSFLIVACSAPLQMAAAYLFFGTGLALFAPTMMTLVADSAPPGALGRAYGLYTTALYIAMSVGPAAGGFLARVAGLRAAFVLSGTIVLTVFAVAFLLPLESHKPHHEPRPPILREIGHLLANRHLTGALLGTVGSCFAFGMFISFLPLHARGHGLDAGSIGIVFGVQALVNALSRLPLGSLGDRPGTRQRLAVAGFALQAVAVAPLGGFATLPRFCSSGALLGIGMALAYTAVGAIIADSVERHLRGLAMGMYSSSIYLAMMASSAIMGPVIAGAGYPVGFAAGGGICAVGATLFLLVSPRSAAPPPGSA